MRRIFAISLSLFLGSATAYAEQSYLMIPDAVDQAEQMGASAEHLARESFHPPSTAGEAMGELRRIDHNLDTIIQLGSRFQATARTLEKGIRDMHRFVETNRQFIQAWSPALQGNDRLLNSALEYSDRHDIRTRTTQAVLSNLVDSMAMRSSSVQRFESIALKFTREASLIAAARQRLHAQLRQIKNELNNIRTAAGKRI